jgi:hypothetical protein
MMTFSFPVSYLEKQLTKFKKKTKSINKISDRHTQNKNVAQNWLTVKKKKKRPEL